MSEMSARCYGYFALIAPLELSGGGDESDVVRIPFDGASVFGRSRKCQVYINLKSVARKHIFVSAEDDGVIQIENLAKRRFLTVVNGRTLYPEETVALHSGDVIAIGERKFRWIAFNSLVFMNDFESGSFPVGESGERGRVLTQCKESKLYDAAIDEIFDRYEGKVIKSNVVAKDQELENLGASTSSQIFQDKNQSKSIQESGKMRKALNTPIRKDIIATGQAKNISRAAGESGICTPLPPIKNSSNLYPSLPNSVRKFLLNAQSSAVDNKQRNTSMNQRFTHGSNIWKQDNQTTGDHIHREQDVDWSVDRLSTSIEALSLQSAPLTPNHESHSGENTDDEEKETLNLSTGIKFSGNHFVFDSPSTPSEKAYERYAVHWTYRDYLDTDAKDSRQTESHDGESSSDSEFDDGEASRDHGQNTENDKEVEKLRQSFSGVKINSNDEKASTEDKNESLLPKKLQFSDDCDITEKVTISNDTQGPNDVSLDMKFPQTESIEVELTPCNGSSSMSYCNQKQEEEPRPTDKGLESVCAINSVSEEAIGLESYDFECFEKPMSNDQAVESECVLDSVNEEANGLASSDSEGFEEEPMPNDEVVESESVLNSVNEEANEVASSNCECFEHESMPTDEVVDSEPVLDSVNEEANGLVSSHLECFEDEPMPSDGVVDSDSVLDSVNEEANGLASVDSKSCEYEPIPADNVVESECAKDCVSEKKVAAVVELLSEETDRDNLEAEMTDSESTPESNPQCQISCETNATEGISTASPSTPERETKKLLPKVSTLRRSARQRKLKEPESEPSVIPYNFLDGDDLQQKLEGLTVLYLKDILRKYGEPLKGRKAELVYRIRELYNSSTAEDKKTILSEVSTLGCDEGGIEASRNTEEATVSQDGASLSNTVEEKNPEDCVIVIPSRLKVGELRACLRQRGISAQGRKDDLIKALQDQLVAEEQERTDLSETGEHFQKSDHPLLWKPVTRMMLGHARNGVVVGYVAAPGEPSQSIFRIRFFDGQTEDVNYNTAEESMSLYNSQNT